MSYSFSAHLARYGPGASYPPMDLAQARRYCERLTRTHYENFSVASFLLPRRLLLHFYPVYAYCRWADDLGDETGGGQTALDLLAWWRGELQNLYAGKVCHPVMIALRPTVERFRIPPTPFLDLLTAFKQDQRVKCYTTFDELLAYCKNSANPVGRLVLYLCESFDETRAALSDRICTGLQLANFWQDVKRDFTELGRVYVPAEDRRRFGYGDDDLRALRFTPAFRELMQFEVERTRRLFDAGRPLIDMIPDSVGTDIRLFLAGGLAILKKIEAVGYDVLTERPKLSKREKATLVLRAVRDHFVLAVGSPPNDSATRSFAWCHRLTKCSAKNFYYSFLVLPRAQRRAMDALYAFMRVTDDLADEAGEVNAKGNALRSWREALDRALAGQYSHPLHPALHQVVSRYGIPAMYLHEVIDGIESDLEPKPFAKFDDLYAYCYRVASAVGLCCIHIWGFKDAKAKQYAEAAGIALQLTNILRDLAEDLDQGRVYLPQDEIERFQCPPDSWRKRDKSFHKLMDFQVERARRYYREAEKLSPYLTPSGRAVFQVMLKIYGGLLEEIVHRDYDVFRDRVKLSRGKKLRQLLRAFPIRWGWL